MQNTEIAEKLGVHPVTLSRWRIGNRFPGRTMMSKIELELGWDLVEQLDAYDRSQTTGDTLAYARALKTHLREQWEVPDGDEEPITEDE